MLVISGDIDIPEARRLTEFYFGDIPAQRQPAAPDLTEPPDTTALSEVYRDKLARVPAVVIGYPGPVRRSPDYNALVMLDLILTGGESSRFQQNLVKGRKSVIQFEANLGWPFAGPTDYKDPGVYAMMLLYNPKFSGDEIVSQAEEEIAQIRQGGPNPGELERARTHLRSSRIRQMQSSHNRALLLGKYELLDGKPDYVNTELDVLTAVTAPEIQAAARKYIDPVRRTVLDIVPAPEEASNDQ